LELEPYKYMCVMCEIPEKVNKYKSLPKQELDSVCSSWDRERMRVISSMPFEAINHTLRKIDKHFERILTQKQNQIAVP
jgi:hypothetical protein